MIFSHEFSFLFVRPNEAKMIEKIARDVSDILNVTPCRDFDGMVGLNDHLREMESLLDLKNDGVKIVGISGPAGIGKSTIATALHDNDISQSEHIPLDLTIEILSRLPAFAPSLSSGRPSPPIKILSTR